MARDQWIIHAVGLYRESIASGCSPITRSRSTDKGTARRDRLLFLGPSRTLEQPTKQHKEEVLHKDQRSKNDCSSNDPASASIEDKGERNAEEQEQDGTDAERDQP
jgi:hypothetical protein